MKKIVLSLSLTVYSLFSLAQQGLLWKITESKSNHTSYLFGSMHTNDSLANNFGQSWWNAMNSCEVFAGEVNTTNQMEMVGAMQVAMMNDRSLADLYSKGDYALIEEAIKSSLDPMTAAVCQKMKPFFVLAAIAEAPKKDAPHSQVMDIRLQQIAVKNGKKVLGLETVVEQASSINVLTLDEQAKLLLDYVKEKDKTKEETETLTKFYIEQNLDSLHVYANKMDYPEKLMKALLDDRNDRFVKNLLPLIQQHSVFCMVGAMHLGGKNGMIAQLRQNGYSVEPVEFKFGD